MGQFFLQLNLLLKFISCSLLIAIKKHIALALSYFFLVALLGLLLRVFVITDVSANYRYLVHAHSHLALLGWVYVSLTSLIYFLFLKEAKINKLYRRIFWFTQITILGMLLTFPFQGYALLSIIFSTLFLIASYFFAWMVIKKVPQEYKSRFSFRCVKAALIYMIISSIGPWALGAIMSTLGSTSIWYKIAIYFYLHFQYNAWFILALIGILLFVFEKQNLAPGEKEFRSFFYLMNAGLILSFFLSVLFAKPPAVFYYLAGAGAVLQVLAFWKLYTMLLPGWKNLRFNSFPSRLLLIAATLMLVKIIMQLFSALPYFANLAFSNLDFVIGYLHGTFLGIISLAIFAFFHHFKLWKISKAGFYIFFAAFLITEILIFYRGTAIWQRWPLPEDFFLYLFAGSCLFPVGIGWIFFSGLMRSFNDKPSGF